MKELKVKSNESLFREGKELGNTLGGTLSGIVQNDMLVTEKQLKDWVQDIKKHMDSVASYTEKVVEYIESGNRLASETFMTYTDVKGSSGIDLDDIPF